MKTCPACAETIQDDALKCHFCGTPLIDEGWRLFCLSYNQLTVEDRQNAWAKLTPEQKATFVRIWPIWQQSRPAPASNAGPSTTNAVAALASFILPGLGQLIQGRYGTAIAFFILAALLWLIFLGWIIHIVAAIDAATWKG